jgi:hypothetical protein
MRGSTLSRPSIADEGGSEFAGLKPRHHAVHGKEGKKGKSANSRGSWVHAWRTREAATPSIRETALQTPDSDVPYDVFLTADAQRPRIDRRGCDCSYPPDQVAQFISHLTSHIQPLRLSSTLQ